MRELSIEDVEAVSGGSNQIEGIAIISAGFGLLKIGGLIGATAIAGATASPILVAAALTLGVVGGFRFGTPDITITEGPNVSGGSTKGSDRSDC